MVQTVKRAMKRMASEEGTEEWTEFLPWVLMGIRSTVAKATKKAPYEILFGRDMRLPSVLEHFQGQGQRGLDFWTREPTDNEISQYASDHVAAIRRIDAEVKDKLQDTAKQMEDLYARSIKRTAKELKHG